MPDQLFSSLSFRCHEAESSPSELNERFPSHSLLFCIPFKLFAPFVPSQGKTQTRGNIGCRSFSRAQILHPIQCNANKNEGEQVRQCFSSLFGMNIVLHGRRPGHQGRNGALTSFSYDNLQPTSAQTKGSLWRESSLEHKLGVSVGCIVGKNGRKKGRTKKA